MRTVELDELSRTYKLPQRGLANTAAESTAACALQVCHDRCEARQVQSTKSWSYLGYIKWCGTKAGRLNRPGPGQISYICSAFSRCALQLRLLYVLLCCAMLCYACLYVLFFGAFCFCFAMPFEALLCRAGTDMTSPASTGPRSLLL